MDQTEHFQHHFLPVYVSPSRNRKHNQMLTFNLSPSPLVLCHLSHLSSTFPLQILAEPQPVQCFPLQCFYLTYPQALCLPPVPLPSTGEWSLITVHGFYDEMPLAHLASSCQLP